MKKVVSIVIILVLSSYLSASEIMDEFTEKYDSLTPPENSSVHSDYLFEQISLGGRYTIMMLEQINQTNNDSVEKTDQLIEKLDILIEQNKTIIDLLKKQQEN